MKSTNFEFLRAKWPQLAGLAGFAEAYAHTDPIASLSKLRTFCEEAVQFIFSELRLPPIPRPNLIDLLADRSFQNAVPTVVVSKMHALRIAGNRAVHGNQGDTSTALLLLRDAYALAQWLFVTFAAGALDACPPFTDPPEGGQEGRERRIEKRAILERVASQEAQMQKLLAELEAARQQAAVSPLAPAELEHAVATARQAGDHAVETLAEVSPLEFSEAETRKRLIDTLLVDAGWIVGAGLASTDEVGKEVEVEGQPTDSGLGYADYVLYDDNGKPLGVIEAKKTALNAEDGRTQARFYADALAKEHGQRPIIFCTNGHEIVVWNDADGEPPREVFGFYSKKSLQRLFAQRAEKLPQSSIGASREIIDRPYQFEAVRRVVEKFAEKKRKALIVQATGTGKTRVAIALADALIRANWAKRVLFVCDRRELRKQAHNAFKRFLPSAPRIYVTGSTSDDQNQRIYLATYPAMMKCYESFGVGFFDLVIADESHRSLYNRYRQLFKYFDAYQVGLTATPVDHVARNTFEMFQCDPHDPTSNYSYEEAINHNPPYLAPFVVDTHTTAFLRLGIKYSQLTDEQKRQLEEDDENPQAVEFELAEVDKYVFNRDTNRHILRNLMDHGIRNGDGSRLGKTIVFARNHEHALLLQSVFGELYPQYGGNFCRVIDHYDPRAEELIDEFKDPQSDLTIAVSVDMLDTGIDVPQIVNLVFAKPVYSFVKFWQMIGRGTRLCPNLFGPGKDKTHFQIFDHWGNFERFDQGFTPAEPATQKSLMQLVFEQRLALARTALEKQESAAFDLAIDLVAKDLAALPEKCIAVREKWREVQAVSRPETLRRFDAVTAAALAHDIAPLMMWCDIAGHEAAYKFDRLIAILQCELLRGSSRFDDFKDTLREQLGQLPINLSQVRVKLPVIERARTSDFWDHVSIADLEELRRELRGIMQYRRFDGPLGIPPKVLDIKEDESLVERKRHRLALKGVEMLAYRGSPGAVPQAHPVGHVPRLRLRRDHAADRRHEPDAARRRYPGHPLPGHAQQQLPRALPEIRRRRFRPDPRQSPLQGKPRRIRRAFVADQQSQNPQDRAAVPDSHAADAEARRQMCRDRPRRRPLRIVQRPRRHAADARRRQPARSRHQTPRRRLQTLRRRFDSDSALHERGPHDRRFLLRRPGRRLLPRRQTRPYPPDRSSRL